MDPKSASPKRRELEPVRDRPADWDQIEKRIRAVFRRLYVQLLKEVGVESPGKTLKNAKDDEYTALLEAIRTGRVVFGGGQFSGRFSAAISKELKRLGARWDRTTGTFKVSQPSLPLDVRMAVSASAAAFEQKLAKIDQTIAQISPGEIGDQVKTADLFDKTLWRVEKDFARTTRSIGVIPDLSPEQRKRISEEWQENLQLYVTDFTQAETQSLRKKIQENVFGGNRREKLVKTIQASYAVSEDKARFLARQETNLLLAKYKETRYQEYGIEEYRWACVHMPHDKTPKQHTLGNVRYSHGILEGKIYRWDNPPITTAPGQSVRRNNPGQDYNCRCYAIPVVRQQEAKK